MLEHYPRDPAQNQSPATSTMPVIDSPTPPDEAEVIEQFRQAMLASGITPPAHILGDGRLHRFGTRPDGRRDDAGWYALHLDGWPAGAFGDWRRSVSETWSYRPDRKLSKADHKARQAALERARKAARRAEIERKAKARASATIAEGIWQDIGHVLPEAPGFWPTYLKRKGFERLPADIALGVADLECLHRACTKRGRKVPIRMDPKGDLALIAPVCDPDGGTHSLQFIGATGEKRFLAGAEVGGHYWPIGRPIACQRLIVVEGIATALSVALALDTDRHPEIAVVAALSGGNIEPAIRRILAARGDRPRPEIIIGADIGEGGQAYQPALDASRALNAKLAIPRIDGETLPKGFDFDDLRQRRGLDAVRACFSAPHEAPDLALEPEPASARQRVHDARQDEQKILRHLATLSPLDYDRARKDAAKALGVRPSTLDRVVEALRNRADSEIEDLDPWPEPIDPAALLHELTEAVQRFVICPIETARAAALWAAMTWLMDAVQVAPIAAITAPEKRCGKSILLTLLGKVCYRPLLASNITPAALFRAVDAWRPTLLIDEADSFARENEELRGLLNSGHTRDTAYVIRVVGEDLRPARFSTWGAKAIAGIGKLADTIMDRAIPLALRRKLPHEQVERLRHADPKLFETLARKLARFAEDYREQVRAARPDLPESLNDRAQDNWEPLLAIADVAGGDWPTLARIAAIALSSDQDEDLPLGSELLADIKTVFETKGNTHITTADLLAALCEDEEAPWSTYNRGKPMTARQLAKRLAEYGIRSATVRIGYKTAKGYASEWFKDAWKRYLPSPPRVSVTPSHSYSHAALGVTDRKSVTVTSVTSVTPQESVTPSHSYSHAALGVTDRKSVTVTSVTSVTPQESVTPSHSYSHAASGVMEQVDCDVVTDCDGSKTQSVTRKPASFLGCDVVTDKKGGERDTKNLAAIKGLTPARAAELAIQGPARKSKGQRCDDCAHFRGHGAPCARGIPGWTGNPPCAEYRARRETES